MKHAIILTSQSALPVAQGIKESLIGSTIYSKHQIKEGVLISSIQDTIADLFTQADSILFIGALGICVRSIAPYIQDKQYRPKSNLCFVGTYWRSK